MKRLLSSHGSGAVSRRRGSAPVWARLTHREAVQRGKARARPARRPRTAVATATRDERVSGAGEAIGYDTCVSTNKYLEVALCRALHSSSSTATPSQRSFG